jgi:hypothetical protein
MDQPATPTMERHDGRRLPLANAPRTHGEGPGATLRKTRYPTSQFEVAGRVDLLRAF